MARVILTGGLLEQAGATAQGWIEIDARDIRELLRKLEPKLPGIGRRVEEGLAIAIDGDIVADPLLEPIAPDSEIHFLPPVRGGSAARQRPPATGTGLTRVARAYSALSCRCLASVMRSR